MPAKKAPASRRVPASARPELFQDFVDMVEVLQAARARFLVIGAWALAAHGVPRATGDLDIWVEPTETNAPRVFEALIRFGAPVVALGITQDDFARPRRVCQLGLPPRRIDVTTIIDGVSFEEAWAGRLPGTLGPVAVAFLGRQSLLRNKAASGRPKDLADLALLNERPAR
jgi:hypothetical protein